MNKMQVWAKILMAVLGLYGLLVLLKDMGNSFASFIYVSRIPDFKFTAGIYILLAISLLFVLLLIFVIYQLLFRGDKWSRRLVEDISEEQNRGEIFWLPASYRLAAFVCGILLLYWTLPAIMQLCYLWISYFQYKPDYLQHKMPGDSTLVTIIRLALSVYLLCGAPRFVRWQVRKALSESKKPALYSATTKPAPTPDV